MEDTGKGDVVWREGENMMVEAVVMEKVHGIIEGGSDMQNCGGVTFGSGRDECRLKRLV